MKNLELIFMTGNVGAGKSTQSTKLTNEGDYVVVSRDDIVTMLAAGNYQKYDLAKKKLYFLIERECILGSLAAGYSVIIDRTNETVKKRKRYIDLVGDEIHKICYDFGRGNEAAMVNRMINNRGRDPRQWQKVFEEVRDLYEQPSLSEGFDEIIIVTHHL